MYNLNQFLKSKNQFKKIQNTLEVHSELKHPRRKFFSDQEPLTPFTKKLPLQCLTKLSVHLCTTKLKYYIKIKVKTKQKHHTMQSVFKHPRAKKERFYLLITAIKFFKINPK